MTAQVAGDPQLHFWLTRSVAKVMGVNLSEAMAQSQLSAQEYASLVTACRQCALVENCQCWLGKQKSISASTPPGCANAKALQNLARA